MEEDAQALAMLIGTMANAMISHIHMVETSVVAWAILKDLYEMDKMPHILPLQREC